MGIHGGFGIQTVAQRSLAVFVLLIFPMLLCAQELHLEYEISNNPVGVKDRIYVIIFVDAPDPSTVTVTAPPLPKEVQITSGPRIDKVAYEGGFRTRITYRLQGEESGRYIIKPFIVTVGDLKAQTDTEILAVGLYRNRVLYMPLKAEWEVPEEAVYVGQSIAVTLRLIHLAEIPLVDSHQIEPPGGAFFEEVEGIREIETVPAGEKSLYNVPVASFMFTPSQSGRHFLPAAKVQALGETATSPVARIEVRSLPPEARESGAVGDFTYSTWMVPPDAESGGVAVLSVQVKGVGNLGYFNMPAPDLGNLVQTDVVETLDSVPTISGYRGTRRVDYHFFSDTAGTFGVSVPDFVYFNPLTETVRSVKGVSTQVTFRLQPQTESPTAGSFPFSLPSYEDLAAAPKWGAYEKPLNYLWLLPAPLAFFVLLVLKKTRVIFVSIVLLFLGAGDVPDTCPDLKPAIEAYSNESFKEAREGFLACFQREDRNPALAYALALVEYHLEEYDQAMHYARKAVLLDPMYPTYRDFMYWLNTELDLDEPVKPAAAIHPDIFFYAMVAFLSMGFVAAAVYLAKRKGLYIVLFGLGVLLSAGSCVGLVQTAIQNKKTAAVVYTQPAAVRKIPSVDANTWLELPPGYSLRILDSTGNFYLVRTAYGITGWVEKTGLLPDKQ